MILGICDLMNLPKTISDRANALSKKVIEGKKLRGQSNNAISLACLFIACRHVGQT